jgi:primosomal protein N' (replication factor Y)
VSLLQLCGGRAATLRSCGGEYLEQAGFGTERLEGDLRTHFPARAFSRSIATPSAGAGRWSACSRAVAAGTVDILVGTQMIAKGHDFRP